MSLINKIMLLRLILENWKKYQLNYKLSRTKKLLSNIFLKNKKSYFVIGISGGIDSLVTLKLLVDLVGPEKILAYYLPIEFDNNSSDIKLISELLNIHINVFNFSNIYEDLNKEFKISDQLIQQNLKPKIRSMFLSSVAAKNNGLVVSCLNYDEYYLGYFTKFGDSNGDVYPLINFCKSEIMNIAKKLKIPEYFINKPPSADLYINQTDENEFGFSYYELDKYLKFEHISKKTKLLIKQRHKNNLHKQTLKKYLFRFNYLRR